MLLLNRAEDFRAEFLLRFTRELIENTDAYQKEKVKAGVSELIKKERETKDRVKERVQQEARFAREIQKKEIKNIVQTRIRKDNEKMSEMYLKGLPLNLEELSEAPIRVFRPKKIRMPALRIPEPPLPATVSYLKPMATSEQIDIGKLNVLVQDPAVKIIECNGPEENIFVNGIMGRKPTAITLSEEEIEELLGKFSKASKIPVNEGLFKAAIGNVVLSAVVSDIVGIKFVIRKIS